MKRQIPEPIIFKILFCETYHIAIDVNEIISNVFLTFVAIFEAYIMNLIITMNLMTGFFDRNCVESYTFSADRILILLDKISNSLQSIPDLKFFFYIIRAVQLKKN